MFNNLKCLLYLTLTNGDGCLENRPDNGLVAFGLVSELSYVKKAVGSSGMRSSSGIGTATS